MKYRSKLLAQMNGDNNFNYNNKHISERTRCISEGVSSD